MRYLADLLTFTRFILTLVLLSLVFTGGAPEVAFTIFIIAELTDAFDGTLASKYPFPKNKTPKYRQYAAKYDMFTDALLAVVMVIYFIARINLVAGLIIGIGYSLLALTIDLIVYGKIMGHPDDCTKNSLAHRNFPLAKKIILTRRMLYLVLIATIAGWTFYSSNCDFTIKIIVTVIALAVSLFLWFFLAQRRKNISRDAVEIEKDLAKKAKR